MPSCVLALDIGATKAAIGIFDLNLNLLKRVDVPTGSNEGIWDSISNAIKEISSDIEIIGIGIGSAGPLHLAAGAVAL